MIEIILPILIGFIITLAITPKTIIFLERTGIVGTDIQKFNKPKIPEMGGITVLIGFLGAIFSFIAVSNFLTQEISIALLAGITTILIVTIIGILDDLSILVKKPIGKIKKIGLKQWQKPLLTLPAAIPLVAIMAGTSTMSIPFIGLVDFGIWYPLILVPIAIIGASNAFNMLAGLNGLEAGLGSVVLSILGIYAYGIGETSASILALSLAASLIAFIYFNWYPAKILPGDSLTYMIGAAIAVTAIIGNMEKIAFLLFLPWFIEFLLKARSGFKAECFGKLEHNQTLSKPYKKIYSLTHVIMSLGKFKESTIVIALLSMELIYGIFLLLIINFI
jgi:UDP-N-acetylglucosamine--dolichyl-phosphate N-acetylglucosaminephosphotransferase